MDFRFYVAIFLRRLPYFLIVSTVISAAAVTAALQLPPAYESRAQIIVESPQIPEELAQSTVRTSPIEQLQIMQNRLLTREILLNIARTQNVFPDIAEMNADQIVNAMRARTTIDPPRGRNAIPLMTLTFEARSPRVAAAVVNEYLTLIQEQDVEFRQGRSGETLEFFEQEVERLAEALDAQSARILQYKQANAGALPESLEFRMSQAASLQNRISQINRDISNLTGQRERLTLIFEQTGNTVADEIQAPTLSPGQIRLQELQAELSEALLLYSPTNARVRLIESRIRQLEAALEADDTIPAQPSTEGEGETPVAPTREEVLLSVQLDEIDMEVAALKEERAEAQARIAQLEASIAETPEVTITLEELERDFATLQAQFQDAEGRLNAARTGDIIETRSRGQRISIIEQPAVPSSPTKPNRVLIAGGGTLFGIAAGVGLVVLLELLNSTVRRPEDLVKRFGITPFTTIPYIPTRGQTFRQRAFKLLLTLAILGGVPALVYAVHTFYLPLDLVADRIMDTIGVRW